MSRVKGKHTSLELAVRKALSCVGLRFRNHVKTLPGKPDIVFPSRRLAVFIDGDFWHGYRFPVWRDDLKLFWRKKIALNRERDRRNFAKLRRMKWRVIRVWGHDVKNDLDGVIVKIQRKLDEE